MLATIEQATTKAKEHTHQDKPTVSQLIESTRATETGDKIRIDTRHVIESPHYGYQIDNKIVEITTTEGYHGLAYYKKDGTPLYVIKANENNSLQHHTFKNLTELFQWVHAAGYTNAPYGIDLNSPEAQCMTPALTIAYYNEQIEKLNNAKFERGVVKAVNEGTAEKINNHSIISDSIIYYDENECKVYIHDNKEHTRLRVKLGYDVNKQYILQCIRGQYSNMIRAITVKIENIIITHTRWARSGYDIISNITLDTLNITYQHDGLALLEKYSDYGRPDWISAYLKDNQIILVADAGPDKTEEPDGIYLSKPCGVTIYDKYTDTLDLEERANIFKELSQDVVDVILNTIQKDIEAGKISNITMQAIKAMEQHEETADIAEALKLFYGIDYGIEESTDSRWPEVDEQYKDIVKEIVNDAYDFYDKLYTKEIQLTIDEYDELLDEGERLPREYKELYCNLVYMRHDAYTSDLELVALAMSIRKYNQEHNTNTPEDSLNNATTESDTHQDEPQVSISEEKGEQLDKMFDIRVSVPISKEVYSLIFQSNEPPKHRPCWLELTTTKERQIIRVGRAYTPGDIVIYGRATVTQVENRPKRGPLRDELCNAIGDIGTASYNNHSAIKMSPEVDDIEAVRHIIDHCIKDLVNVFSWNDKEEQDAIMEACTRAKEKLLQELEQELTS